MPERIGDEDLADNTVRGAQLVPVGVHAEDLAADIARRVAERLLPGMGSIALPGWLMAELGTWQPWRQMLPMYNGGHELLFAVEVQRWDGHSRLVLTLDYDGRRAWSAVLRNPDA